MSSDREQAGLDAFAAARVQQDPQDSPEENARVAPQRARYGRTETETVDHGDEPAAKPQKDHNQCQNCGAHVSLRMRRVFGDSANVMWHCLSCVDSRGALAVGAGADPEYEHDPTLASQRTEVRY